MKRLWLVVIITGCLNTQAQVKFEPLNLAAAIQTSANTGKIIFAQFVSETCDECNDVAERALSEPALGKIVNEKCIPLEIGMKYADRETFINKYNPQKSIGTFFISGDGELIHRYPLTTTRYADYITQVDDAYSKLTEGKVTLKELDQEWVNNAGNIHAMQLNLARRLLLGLQVDSLLEVFVTRLPNDSLQSVSMLGFIAQQAPSVFSQANYILRKDRPLFSRAWSVLPLPQRIAINNRIANKSMQKAIAGKNEIEAIMVANFLAGTHDDRTSLNSTKAYDRQMLNYFMGIKDTAAFLSKAIDYYDRYAMAVGVTQVLARDSAAMKKVAEQAIGDTVKDKDHPGKFVVKKSFAFRPQAQLYTNELNEGAWLIYTSSNDMAMLNKAVEWVKRANEFYGDSPGTIDTYARLLYKTGAKNDAIKWQSKAIEILKARKFNYNRYEEVLTKMKNGDEVM